MRLLRLRATTHCGPFAGRKLFMFNSLWRDIASPRTPPDSPPFRKAFLLNIRALPPGALWSSLLFFTRLVLLNGKTRFVAFQARIKQHPKLCEFTFAAPNKPIAGIHFALTGEPQVLEEKNDQFERPSLRRESRDVQGLKEMIAVGVDVNHVWAHGWSLLHFAARAGHAETSKLFLDGRASVNAANEIWQTPLNIANGRSCQLVLADAGCRRKTGRRPLAARGMFFKGHKIGAETFEKGCRY
jgi:hypothetical protein